MAKKDNDNFDFETEGKAKVSFDLSFLKNLTNQQKGIIIIAAVAVVLVIAIVVACIALGTSNNPNNSDNTNDDSSSDNQGVIPEVIEAFYISEKPAKLTYYVGDAVDYTGLVAYFVVESEKTFVSYSSNPDAFTITGFDSSAPADELVITVECRGFTDTFTVKVLAKDVAQASLVGITIDPLPVTSYKVGDSFDTTGGYIVAEYSDGTTVNVELTMKHIFGFGVVAYTPGEHQIKIKYADDHGGYAETYITITITE